MSNENKPLSFDELENVNGGTNQVINTSTTIKFAVTCPTCNGTGTIGFGKHPAPCPTCGGKDSAKSILA